MTVVHFALAALDPRGRASRGGLLIIAAALVVIEIVGASLIYVFGFDPQSIPILALKALFVWLAIAAAAKRLHDLGLSAWWIPTAFALQMLWTATLAVAMHVSFGIEYMQPGSDGYAAMLAGCFVPIFGVMLWLHVTRGETDVNRYGLPPQGLGISTPGGGFLFWTSAARS